jgi:fermentation-respiration switch protein FrsA (DUF1100 family)
VNHHVPERIGPGVRRPVGPGAGLVAREHRDDAAADHRSAGDDSPFLHLRDLPTIHRSLTPENLRAALLAIPDELIDAATVDGLNPVEHADKLLIPIMVYHGDRDQTVPLEQSEWFVSKAKSTALPT